MAIRLGVNTCFAVKRWVEPRVWTALVADLGVDCCQVSFDLVDPALDRGATFAYADAVRSEAAAAGIELHSTFTGLAAYSSNQLLHPVAEMRVAARRWFERAIELTAHMGVHGAGGFVGALTVQDARDSERRTALVRTFGAELRGLADHAAAQGVDFLLFENMAVEREVGHRIEEVHELEALLAGSAVPWRLCLDVGHPCALHTGTASDDPIAWLRERWAQRPVLQVQQANRDGDFHWPFTDARNAVGLVDAAAIVAELDAWPTRDDGPDDVYVFLEVIHPFETDDDVVLDEMRTSVAHWRAVLDRRPTITKENPT